MWLSIPLEMDYERVKITWTSSCHEDTLSFHQWQLLKVSVLTDKATVPQANSFHYPSVLIKRYLTFIFLYLTLDHRVKLSRHNLSQKCTFFKNQISWLYTSEVKSNFFWNN